MNSLGTNQHDFGIIALSRRREVVAAAHDAVRNTGLRFETLSTVSGMDAVTHAGSIMLLDAEIIDTPNEVEAVLRHLSGSGVSVEPALVLIDESENARPLRRHALRILALPLQGHALTEALEAAQLSLMKSWNLRARLKDTERALDQRDEFLATLVHEVRNPLAVIQNVADMLSLGNAEISDVPGLLSRQVSHLARLLESIYKSMYLNTEDVNVGREQLQLDEIVAHALEMVDASLRSRNQSVRVRTDEPLSVWGDRAQITQIVSNILDNAIKYSEDGLSVEVTLYSEGSFAVIAVQDSGEGIDAEDIPRVFLPFVQRASHSDKARTGLGLGLAIVKRLVVLHGGSVSVRSEGRGHGSRFEIRLPRVRS